MNRLVVFCLILIFSSCKNEKDAELNNRFKGLMIDNLVEIDPRLKPLFHELLRQSTGVSYKTDAEWIKWWKTQGEKKSGT